MRATEDRQRLKEEIIAELKEYIETAFCIKFEDAASPAIKQLSNEIDNLFRH